MRATISVLFDINRTILIEDKAGGKLREDEIKAILADISVGVVSESKEWIASEPSSECTTSYSKFLEEHLYPYPQFEQHIPFTQRQLEMRAIKAKRLEKVKLFVNPGQPGESYINLFNVMCKSTEHPEQFSLIPSFYHFIDHFAHNSNDFKFTENLSICFRSFGHDLPDVVNEWNSFCEGKHPNYIKFYMEKAKISKKNCGAYFRTGPKSEDCHLIMGTFNQPHTPDQGLNFYNEERRDGEIFGFNQMGEFYKRKEGNDLLQLTGFNEIDNFLQLKYREGSNLALHDYYPWWMSQGEKFDSGKLIFVGDECVNPNSTRVLQFFFDDNLKREYKETKKNILDARCITTGNSIEDIDHLIGKFLIIAEAQHAILDKDYFVKIVRKSLENFSINF